MNNQTRSQIDHYDRVQRLPWYDHYVTQFARFIGPERGIAALCVQCGPGLMARKLGKLGVDVCAIDDSEAMVEMAAAGARRGRVRNMTAQTASSTAIPFSDGTFDLTVAVTLIHAVDDPIAVLAEMARVTKVGGIVATLDPSLEMRSERVLSYVAKNSLTGFEFKCFQAWSDEARERERLSVFDLERLYGKAGLEPPVIEEQMDRMLLAVKGRKPQKTPHTA